MIEKTSLHNLVTEYMSRNKEAFASTEDSVEGNEATQENFGTALLEDGTTIYFPGDVIEVGSPVTIDSEEGDVLADGTYVLEDGSTFITSDGAVSEIPTEEEEAPEEEDATKAEAELEVEEPVMATDAEVIEAIREMVMSEVKAELDALKASNEAKTEEIAELMSKTPAVAPTVEVETAAINKYEGFSAKKAAHFAHIDELLKLKNS